MEVNKKCDVYSFRVLTLEIIMGKHPGDLISFLSSFSSSSATSSTGHNILLKDILDLRLEPPENEVLLKVVSIVKLAFACLATNPKSRPAMQEVSRELSIGSAPISSELFDTLTLGLLFNNGWCSDYVKLLFFMILFIVCPSVCFIELNLINKPVGIQFRITSESDPEEPMGQL